MDVRIAVVQMVITQGNIEKNMTKIERYIARASGKADIIIFPEYCVTGPSIVGHDDLIDYEGRYVQHFQRLARKYMIDIVPGALIEGDGSGWHNTTYYINRRGKIEGRYRKVNLWHPERPHLVPGDEFVTVQTDYGRIGLIICWDLAFPEAFRAMMRQGAQIVICPSYWSLEDAGPGMRYDPYSEVRLVDSFCTARAFENEIALVFANAAYSLTRFRRMTCVFGYSQITAPFCGALQRLPHGREKMFIQSIDTSLLKCAEHVYAIKKDVCGEQCLYA